MKKPKKLLRKLLRKYQDELLEKPFTSSATRAMDCIDVLLSILSEDKKP